MRVGDRHHRLGPILAVQRSEVGDVEPAVERGQTRQPQPPADRKMEIVDVEVNDVEAVRRREHLLHHQDVVRELVDATLVQPQRTPAGRNQAGAGHRVAAREQGDVVALPDQFPGQVGDDPLGAPVEPGRHTLKERGDLRNSHDGPVTRKIRALGVSDCNPAL